jgi:lysophospholipase L1-like esterase
MQLEANQTLLFIGDSITDCGRARPFGTRGQLGDGYVSTVDNLLGAFHPELPIRVLNTGISGNRVTDLESRWQADVIAHQPDWLSIMIGINDVWRHFDGEPMLEQVDAERFESVYRHLVEKTQPDLKGLVLMSPFFLEPNKGDPMRSMMDKYGAIVRRIAADFGTIFVDVQAAFDAYLAHRPTQSLCGDRVHPNGIGHAIIARAFLASIGSAWASFL